MQDFWGENKSLHINLKELEAAAHTVRSLAKPKERVVLHVDNSVTYSYLSRGGGRLPHLNVILRPLRVWCVKHHVHPDLRLVTSQQDQADFWSRPKQDHGDYTLDRKVFLKLLTVLAHVQGGA